MEIIRFSWFLDYSLEFKVFIFFWIFGIQLLLMISMISIGIICIFGNFGIPRISTFLRRFFGTFVIFWNHWNLWHSTDSNDFMFLNLWNSTDSKFSIVFFIGILWICLINWIYTICRIYIFQMFCLIFGISGILCIFWISRVPLISTISIGILVIVWIIWNSKHSNISIDFLLNI